MKKIFTVFSSIIVAVSIYLSVGINKKIDDYVAETYDLYKGMVYEGLLILIIGIIIGWNFYMLQKSDMLCVVISLVIAILLGVAMYTILFTSFLYPLFLIGAYGYLLVAKIIENNKINQ